MAKKIITGSQALLRSLACENVDLVFGYPGGSIMPVYDELYDYRGKINHILTRHEQGAIHAAQGYARATGRPGVVIATSGPGATNLITGIADAKMDSTPLIVITGQVSTTNLGSDTFQETDMIDITNPISKWAIQVRSAEEIPWAVARAFHIASTGRPGPVIIDIPKDAQTGTMHWQEYSKCDFIRSYEPVPELDDDKIQLACEILETAEQPLMIIGQGVILSSAEQEVLELIEKVDMPVASTLLGLSAVPTAHPLNKGMVGMHGNLSVNVCTNRADVILAVGMRFDDRATANLDTYAKQAQIIHIDIDASEIGKLIHPVLSIHADARQALRAIVDRVKPASHTHWIESFVQIDQAEQEMVINNQLYRAPGSTISMGEVVRKVSEATNNDAIMVTDVGQNQMFGARYFRFSSPRSCITSGGLGTMGFGVPAAVGAKLAVPDREVVVFVGDGGFQMTMQELGTIMENNIAVKIVILNNDFLGNVRQWQELFFNNRFSYTPMVNPDFIKIASAYGIEAESVEERTQLDDAISRMLNHDGPYLLNVNIDPVDKIFPMIPIGGSIDKMLLVPNCLYEIPVFR